MPYNKNTPFRALADFSENRKFGGANFVNLKLAIAATVFVVQYRYWSFLLLSLPRIYPILNLTDASTRESSKQMIHAYLDAGIDLFQVRAKGLADREFCSWIEFCLKESSETTCRVLVNDRPDIAIATGAAGVHLGQTDLSPTLVRENFSSQLILGLSCHSEEQIAQAPLASLDYVALGPIFPTKTKANPDPTIGLNKLSDCHEILRARDSDIPLVAIGGIEISSLRRVIDHGANSVALISALGGPNEIRQRLKEAKQNVA
ncbi:MAG: thiamine phosphate synthase [Myxococcota bacterium]|nr:thiamine phosphate synthase [Myxococcota bacterium]